jgi:probable addiction module antidote protein
MPTTETTEGIKTTAFDPAEYLDTPEAQAELLNDALETGDRAYILDALGIIARAKGMTELARETGVKRATLYNALGSGGNPTFDTMMSVFDALGLRLAVSSARARVAEADHQAGASRRIVQAVKRKAKPAKSKAA